MELSIFLAKFLGLYILIFVAIWVARKKQVDSSLASFLSNKTLLFFSGLISLMFGVAIVISHCIWELNWRGLITLFGYLAILKGVMRMGFPEFVKTTAFKILKGKGGDVVRLVMLVIGAFLAYSGFTA